MDDCQAKPATLMQLQSVEAHGRSIVRLLRHALSCESGPRIVLCMLVWGIGHQLGPHRNANHERLGALALRRSQPALAAGRAELARQVFRHAGSVVKSRIHLHIMSSLQRCSHSRLLKGGL